MNKFIPLCAAEDIKYVAEQIKHTLRELANV